MEVLYPRGRKNRGKNLGRHLDLSERGRTFARKKRRGKRVMRKAAIMKRKAIKAIVRSRMDELLFRTFKDRTAAVNIINGIEHIDTLLRPCAARSWNVIGLQGTKRDGTSEIIVSGYRVCFSGGCTGVKERQERTTLGWLAMKEEIIQNTGTDGIVIGCISARLLNDRIPIKFNFVTFLVAYAPFEEAPEGQKVKHMAALNSTVASVPVRECIFV